MAAFRAPKDYDPDLRRLRETIVDSTPLLRELAQITVEYLTAVLPELHAAFSLQEDDRVHQQQVNALCMLDDSRLVSAHGFLGVGPRPELCAVKVWDLKRRCLSHTLLGHQSWVYCVCAFPSSRGRPLIATGSGDKTIKIWDADAKKCVQTTNCSGVVMSIASWGVDQIVAGCSGSRVCIISAAARRCEFSWQVSKNPVCVWSVVKSSQDDALLCGLDNALIELWRVRSPHGADRTRVFRGHVDVVRSLTQIDTDRFASSSFDGTCMVWSFNSGNDALHTLRHGHGLRGLSVLPAGYMYLATGAADNNLKIWDPRSGACVFTQAGAHGAPIWATCMTASGMLVSGSTDNAIKVWYVELMLR